MKKIILLVIFFLSCALMVCSQDFYTDTGLITVDNITYKVVRYNHVIHLKNIENTLVDRGIINLKTNKPYDIPGDMFPRYYPRPEKIKIFIDQIIHPKNKEYNSLIDIIMAVDPKSCTVKELYFDFYVDESTVSIPPKKFAELERALIGKNFGFKLDDCYIDANYLRGYFRYEF